MNLMRCRKKDASSTLPSSIYYPFHRYPLHASEALSIAIDKILNMFFPGSSQLSPNQSDDENAGDEEEKKEGEQPFANVQEGGMRNDAKLLY